MEEEPELEPVPDQPVGLQVHQERDGYPMTDKRDWGENAYFYGEWNEYGEMILDALYNKEDDSLIRSQEFEYDEYSRVVRITIHEPGVPRQDGRIDEMTYFENTTVEQTRKETMADGSFTLREYDELSRLIVSTSGHGEVTEHVSTYTYHGDTYTTATEDSESFTDNYKTHSEYDEQYNILYSDRYENGALANVSRYEYYDNGKLKWDRTEYYKDNVWYEHFYDENGEQTEWKSGSLE